MNFTDEPREMCGVETLYREMGYFLKKRKQYRRSMKAFDEALASRPNDVRALVGRSWSRCRTNNYKCAIEDMDTALALKPRDLRVIQLKALYTYFAQNFEDALVQNIRGIPRRKKPGLFIIGKMECEEEDERCIGKRGGPALRDHYDIIRTIAWKKAADLRRGFQYKPRNKKRKKKEKITDNTPAVYTKYMKKIKEKNRRLGPDTGSCLSIVECLSGNEIEELYIEPKKKSIHQPPQRRTSNILSFLAEKYLNRMVMDKKFYMYLKDDPRIECPNKEGSKIIARLAKQGFAKAKLCQKILRIRLPYYSIKYAEIKKQGTAHKRVQAELRKLQDVATAEVENLLRQLTAAYELRQTYKCILIANRAKAFIDKKPLKVLPDKEVYLKDIYELIGLAYLDVYRLRENMTEVQIIKRINFSFGLQISRPTSRDSVIEQYQKDFISAKKALSLTEGRLEAATTPLETIWLYYDSARFCLHLNKWDLSRFYARKAFNMARVLENYVWATNSNMLIISSHVQQSNINEAKNELVRTIDIAKNLENTDILVYINKCIEMVVNIGIDASSPMKIIFDREQEILKGISGHKLQVEITHLFGQMAALPASRRMSIMPGVRIEDESAALSRKSSSKPSIKPKSKADLEFDQIFEPKGLDNIEMETI